MNLNDLRDDLNEEIDAKGDFKCKKVSTDKIQESNTNDVLKQLDNVDISGLKNPRIFKNKTKNFDGFTKNHKLRDIDVKDKKKKPKTVNYYQKAKKQVSPVKSPLSRNIKIFFGVVLIIFVIKFSVESFIHSGYNRLVNLREKPLTFELIQKEVNNARFDFILSDLLFSPFKLIPNQNLKNAHYVIEGGKNITALGDHFLQYVLGLQDFVSKKGLSNIYISHLLLNSQSEFLNMEMMMRNSLYNYQQIENIGNTQLEEKLSKGVGVLIGALNYLHVINSQFDVFLNLLGHTQDRKYLIVFQNNDEIRPTGGFMGSMGELTLSRGKIKDFKKTDIYAYEWEINKVYLDKIPAPKGLDQITGTFGLRDANYYVGFDSSAKNIKKYMDMIHNDIDGVIFINQNIILDLLDITGPIEFEKINETISSDNFSEIISTLVEAKTFKVGTLGTPKQILFDFSQEFFKTLENQQQFAKYVTSAIEHVLSRDIVLYSYHPEENSLLWKLGLTGQINYASSLDFSYPVFTSLSGNKSDRYVSRRFVKNVVEKADCSIDTSLDIVTSHHYTKKDEENIGQLLDKYNILDKNHIQYIQGRGDNYQFVRLLLPKDAIIKDAHKYTVIQTDNFKILEFFIRTRRLETVHNYIEYGLPNTQCEDYSYKLYKQPGIHKYNFDYKNQQNQFHLEDHKSDVVIKKDS